MEKSSLYSWEVPGRWWVINKRVPVGADVCGGTGGRDESPLIHS